MMSQFVWMTLFLNCLMMTIIMDLTCEYDISIPVLNEIQQILSILMKSLECFRGYDDSDSDVYSPFHQSLSMQNEKNGDSYWLGNNMNSSILSENQYTSLGMSTTSEDFAPNSSYVCVMYIDKFNGNNPQHNSA